MKFKFNKRFNYIRLWSECASKNSNFVESPDLTKWLWIQQLSVQDLSFRWCRRSSNIIAKNLSVLICYSVVFTIICSYLGDQSHPTNPPSDVSPILIVSKNRFVRRKTSLEDMPYFKMFHTLSLSFCWLNLN